MNAISIPVEQQTPMQAYETLPRHEQVVLQIGSAYSSTPDLDAWSSAYNHWQAKVRSDKQLLKIELQDLLEEFELLKIMEKKPWRKASEIKPELSRKILLHAYQQKNLSQIKAAVLNTLKIPPSIGQLQPKLKPEIYAQILRLAFYDRDGALVSQLFKKYGKRMEFDHQEFFRTAISLSADKTWFKIIPSEFKYSTANHLLNIELLSFNNPHQAMTLFNDIPPEPKKALLENQTEILGMSQLIQGNFNAAANILKPIKSWKAFALRGWLALLSSTPKEALPLFKKCYQTLDAKALETEALHAGPEGLLFFIAMLEVKERDYLRTTNDLLDSYHPNPENAALKRTLKILEARTVTPNTSIHNILCDMKNSDEKSPNPFKADPTMQDLIHIFSLYWIGFLNADAHLADLKSFHERVSSAGYLWPASELAEIIYRLDPHEMVMGQHAQEFREQHNARSILDALNFTKPWEQALQALIKLNPNHAQPESNSDTRLAWMLTFKDDDITIIPKEQTRKSNDKWSAGRVVPLADLQDLRSKFPYLTAHDHAVCDTIAHSDNSWGYRSDIRLELEKALVALAKHPHVFSQQSPTQRLDLSICKPELRVLQSGSHFELKMTPHTENLDIPQVIQKSPYSYNVYILSEEQKRLGAILGKSLAAPESARDQVHEVIESLSSLVTIQTDIVGDMTEAKTVEPDNSIHIHLRPFNSGLQIKFFIKPLGVYGPRFVPGNGAPSVIAKVLEERQTCTRDLTSEAKLATEIEAQLTPLADFSHSDYEWIVSDAEACLESIFLIKQLEDRVTVYWPEGESFKIRKEVGASQFKASVTKAHEWFEAKGSLEVDPKLSLEMDALLELYENRKGRFLPMADGTYLALENSFQKRIDALFTFSKKKDDGIQFHPMASQAIQELANDGGELKGDKAWKNWCKRLESGKAYDPKIPSTFQGELRSYQEDGFKWMSRLAFLGIGGCLADDMGLGKTIQAITALLDRAPNGPALIIAPTSVCMNWETEIQRFAPTLKFTRFAGKNRTKLLKKLKKFDVLICSYALLQIDGEQLAATHWHTLILDEAQAIKNAATKRSKTAMSLTADFKLITTGTPIENHLGELWNLFNFLNPGFLGTQKDFTTDFIGPIERKKNRKARNHLRKLIQPYILRRTKTQVLQELPPRTDIVLHVEMSPEERTLYEAVRTRALKNIQSGDLTAGKGHIQILAALMQLRRACCNPNLIAPEKKLESAKLTLFANTIEELRENNHKALVFSQFVGHLALIREYLDQANIPYRYLDGSTPIAKRKKEVDAFQAGEGDLFLISLKAGGTGLNLTAADYVIHMDPWWNPAVEDQASDRAHRIGQQRPVTIYRMVTKDSIEEKIVEMHARKRDLADQLLDGSDMSGKLSTKDLMNLLKNG